MKLYVIDRGSVKVMSDGSSCKKSSDMMNKLFGYIKKIYILITFKMLTEGEGVFVCYPRRWSNVEASEERLNHYKRTT